MSKRILWAVIAVWLLIIASLLINLIRQEKVRQYNRELLNLYELKSQVPDKLPAVRDSLQRQIKLKESRVGAMRRGFPLKNMKDNLLLLYPIAVGGMALLWIYRRRQRQAENQHRKMEDE